jgi:glutaredoxin
MSYPLPEKFGYTVFTRKNCTFCDKLKHLFFSEAIEDIKWIESDEFIATNKYAFLLHVENCAGVVHTTFPIVFHNGSFVGGYNDTVAYVQTV